jgi:ArsR family transcriptional regulator
MSSQNTALPQNEQVSAVRDKMPDIGELFDLAELFKTLGDSTRVRILSALSISELCVNDIAEVLEMDRTAVSHQLRILRTARLIRGRRSGKMVYYSLDDEHVSQIFALGFAHISE